MTTSPTADATDAVYASTFTHANEVAKPGYYKVGLDSGATAELAATERTGSGRFTFPADKAKTVLFRTANSEVGSTEATVSVDAAAKTVSGSVTSGNFCGYLSPVGRQSYYTLYFTAVFDQPFSRTGTWKDGTVTPGGTSESGAMTFGPNGRPPTGVGSGAYVGFDAATVNMRVAISYVSLDNARANLRAENRGSFENVRDRAYNAWRRELSGIRIGGGTADQRTIFYTALYHSLLHPNLFSDVNGEYRGFDQKTHKVRQPQRAQYANFSGWDIYRSQVQLVTLLEPAIGSDIAQSLLNQADQNGGTWDRWTHASGGTHVMTGDPSAPALAGIYAFGGTRFDVRSALNSLVTAATVPTPADLSGDGRPVMSVGQRPSLDKYLKLHYVPAKSNAWGGASETLEEATADFAVAQLAQRTGNQRRFREFLARSQYWQSLFNPAADPSGGYVQNRNEDGSWPAFNPATFDGFAEGSSAQYTWMVPHNVAGLASAMGGPDTAARRLDDFFHNPDGSWALTGAGDTHAEMDNEPSINTVWLYDYLGRPHLTQQAVRQTINMLWTTAPAGIPGNDDLGEMSSWLVWSALGLYPQVPSRAELLVASPLFPFASIRRGGGDDDRALSDGRDDDSRSITIRAPQAATDAPYVHALKVNGQTSNRPWLPESFVSRGGRLDFTLAGTPDPAWGSKPGDAPPSWRDGELPYQTTTSTGRIIVPPGSPGESLDIKAVRLSGATTAVNYTVTAPAGLTVTPSSGTFTVDAASGVGSARITVSAPASTPDGRYAVGVAMRTADGKQLPNVGFTVVVGQPGTFTVLRDNVGVSDDKGTHEEADYDGGGVSYSRQALAAAGLVPGGTGTVGGLSFTWPSVPAGEPDNIPSASQTLNLSGLPATATKLSFVGSAVNGNQQATAVVTYTDGSTETIDLSYGDWTLGGGGGTVMFGNLVVAKTGYRNVVGGVDAVAAYIFATAPFAVPAGKHPASVRLPANTDIHVFAVAAG